MLEVFTVTIPELTADEERKAYIWVPDSFEEDHDQRYPVLYMFDGHNLFSDEEASYGKSWGLTEFMEEYDVPLIIAGVECNHHPEQSEFGGRLSEYSPFDFSDPHWGQIKGRGKITMDWFVQEFKPFIDENYPTLPQRENTFISGSSMGGLMTLYALMDYNDVFSRGAALSPSLGFSRKEVLKMIENGHIGKNTVLYMDNGAKEMKKASSKRTYGEVTSELIQKGVLVTSRVVPGGFHSEASWEKSIPFFMEVLLFEGVQ